MSLSVHDCRFLELDEFADPRGKLSFVQNDARIPFEIQRMYFLYDVPFGAERAAHAHKDLHQLFFAFSGAYRLRLDDGNEQRDVIIKQPNRPFYVCPEIWRTVDDFTSGAVCAVLASELYSEADYLRSYDDFIAYVKAQGKPVRGGV